MDSANWRKFLSSAGAVQIQKDNEESASNISALKNLLGHWRHRRRKPLLRQDDIETPTEERQNPIFEDSESPPQSELATADATPEAGSTVLRLEEEPLHPPSSNDGKDSKVPPKKDLPAVHGLFVGEQVKEGSGLDTKTDIPKGIAAKSSLNDQPSSVSNLQSSEVRNEVKTSGKLPGTRKKQLDAKTNTRETADESAGDNETKQKEVNRHKLQAGKSVKGSVKKGAGKSIPEAVASTSSEVSDTGKLSKVEKQKASKDSSDVNSQHAEKLGVQSTMDRSRRLRSKALDELIKKFQGPSVAEVRASPKIEHTSSTKEDTIIASNQYKVIQLDDTKVNSSSQINGTSLTTSLPFKFPPPPPESEIQEISSEAVSNNKNETKVPALRDEGETRSDSSLNRGMSASNLQEKVKTKNRQYVKNNQKLNKMKGKHRSKIDHTANDKILDNSETNIESKTENTSALFPSDISNHLPLDKSINYAKDFHSKNSETKISMHSEQSSKAIDNQMNSFESPNNDAPTTISTKIDYENVENYFNRINAANTISTQKNPSTKTAKLQSEDSGITRGDQASDSSLTQNTHADTKNSTLENIAYDKIRDPKPFMKPSKHRPCKHCRSKGNFSAHGRHHEYYDSFIGFNPLRSRHRDSWTSDISWEDFIEREYLWRLRNKKARASLRSNSIANSRKSRRDLRRKSIVSPLEHIRNSRIRRSLSDHSSSTIYQRCYKPASSICSCDECKSAVGRSSVRSKKVSRHPSCTCGTHSPDLSVDSRKVKFAEHGRHSILKPSSLNDFVPGIPSEKVIPEEKLEDLKATVGDVEEKGLTPLRPKSDVLQKDSNGSARRTRPFMSSWELELWEAKMRIQTLKSRRQRARFMGIMALALVAFVGVGVTLLIVFLRNRKQSL